MSPHGTYSRYTNGGCRCEACRAASAAYRRAYNARMSGPAERSNEPWTPKEEAYALRAHYEDGEPIEAVARRLGRSGNAVIQKLWRMNSYAARKRAERQEKTCQSIG